MAELVEKQNHQEDQHSESDAGLLELRTTCEGDGRLPAQETRGRCVNTANTGSQREAVARSRDRVPADG